MRRDKLEFFVGFGHEFLEPGGAFIVKDVQGRLEAAQTEVFVNGGVAAHKFCFTAIFHGSASMALDSYLWSTMSYLLPFLDVVGKRPDWSVETFPLIYTVFMKIQLV